MIKMKDLLTEGNAKVVTEAIDNDWQALRQELLQAARGMAYTIDNSNSPNELGDEGFDPKKLQWAMKESRKFLTKILKLETEWNNISRKF